MWRRFRKCPPGEYGKNMRRITRFPEIRQSRPELAILIFAFLGREWQVVIAWLGGIRKPNASACFGHPPLSGAESAIGGPREMGDWGCDEKRADGAL